MVYDRFKMGFRCFPNVHDIFLIASRLTLKLPQKSLPIDLPIVSPIHRFMTIKDQLKMKKIGL